MGIPLTRAELMRGGRLGAYEILRHVGHGATASVFEGRHVALGKQVAIKVLHEHLASDAQVAARFLREGRVAAQLRHPNVLDVLDVGEEHGVAYLVMEMLEGRDLKAELARGPSPMPLTDVVAYTLPIASALAHAHDLGVVHRDLKPANIFLAHDVRGGVIPKLVDFGLSKLDGLNETKPLTESEIVAGTVAYMAPEQTYGVGNAGPPADQFALGAIVYECATGRVPFSAATFYELIEQIRAALVKPPSMCVEGLPEAFDAVVLRALARDPTKRWPDVRAFAAALLAFADAETAAAWRPDFVPDALPSRAASRPRVLAARREPSDPFIASAPNAETAVASRAAAPAIATAVATPPASEPAIAPAVATPPASEPAVAPAVAIVRASEPARTSDPAIARGSNPAIGSGRFARARDADDLLRPPPLPVPAGTSSFHVKGMPYRGLTYFVSRVVPGGLARFEEELDDAALRAFIRQPFLASGRYDILPIRPITATLARLLEVPFVELVKSSTAAQARYDSRTVFQRLIGAATLEDWPSRVQRFGAQYYDFGPFDAERDGPGTIVLKHSGVPEYIYPWHGPMQAAYGEEIARVLGAKTAESEVLAPEPGGVVDGMRVVIARARVTYT